VLHTPSACGLFCSFFICRLMYFDEVKSEARLECRQRGGACFQEATRLSLVTKTLVPLMMLCDLIR
jgi:hypothetical protein